MRGVIGRRSAWWAVGAIGLSIGVGAAARDEPPAPVLTRDASTKRDWTVHIEVALRSPSYLTPGRGYVGGSPVFELSSARFFFSRIGATASSEVWPERTSGWARVNATPVDQTLEITKGQRPGVEILTADVGETRCNDLTFSVDTTVTSYETKLDEKRAAMVPWPKEEWPDELGEWLKPEPFVECESDAIVKQVKTWVGPEPRALGPMMTAKLITSKVVAFYQPSGNLFYSGARTNKYFSPGQRSVVIATVPGVISGFQVDGAAAALSAKRGAPMNLPCLLVACWRAAGIPSRLVIGPDVEKSQQDRKPVMHSWAEFALYNESAKTTEWIPVDVLALRNSGSRTPPITQAWLYFGDHTELENFAPIAFHWVPPTEERVFNSGVAGVWAWNAEPETPFATAEFRMSTAAAARRSGDPKR